MRHARLTWPGAYHHLMNRGHGGENIFADDSLKKSYLNILEEAGKIFQIPVHAYCIMDNHFHLVVQNASGQLSRFMKVVHTRYGFLYRHQAGGKGYVFQDRFKSTIIQDDTYMLQAVLYVLNNPVRAGIVQDAADYPWSSAGEYFNKKGSSWIKCDFVEGMFSGKQDFSAALHANIHTGLHENKSRYGLIMGDEKFVAQAESRFDRRSEGEDPKNCRKEDKYLQPVGKVFLEFAREIGKTAEEIDTGSHDGKQQRAELLVLLKDMAGLTYREIKELDIFSDLAFSSLGRIYANAKKKK